MTESFYFLNYLKDSGRLSPTQLEGLRHEYDRRIYAYGRHFRYPFTKRKGLGIVYDELLWYLRLLQQRCRNPKAADVVSNAYSVVNAELRSLGYSVVLPPWDGAVVGQHPSMMRSIRCVQRWFRDAEFKDLLTEAFIYQLTETEKYLREYFNNFRALIVPYDIIYFEHFAIHLFAEVNKPSFVFLHGLPGRYNAVDDQRAMYLLVWGEAIKAHYVRAGGKADRILVVGRPGLQGEPKPLKRASLDNVLVLTKSIPGGQPITGETHISDRGNLILYLYMVQDALYSLGVRQARFRPHPSESGAWYLNYIDTSFYRLDRAPLADSLSSASLVIGPTTTVFLDSLYAGKEYCVFEPSAGNIDIVNYSLVPPFDGSDHRVPVAKDVETLKNLLRAGAFTDQGVLDDYIARPFDLSILKTMILSGQ